MEHRWGVRTQVDLAVRLAGNSLTVLDGRLVNMSVSGAYIVSGCPVNRMTCLEVQIRGTRHTSLKIPACVIRRGVNGIGVEWLHHASPAVREVLQATAATREFIKDFPEEPGLDQFARQADSSI
jgi:hypothetical protein